MKATELQIFDWVFNKHHKKYIQITPYDFFNHAHLPSGEKYFVGELKVISGRDFEPIPLTAEILERNGFVIKKKWAQKGNFGDNPLIMWHYDDDIITRDFKHELEIHQNDTGKVHIRVQCDYVHELQNALRLCGQAELANDFKVEE